MTEGGGFSFVRLCAWKVDARGFGTLDIFNPSISVRRSELVMVQKLLEHHVPKTDLPDEIKGVHVFNKNSGKYMYTLMVSRKGRTW